MNEHRAGRVRGIMVALAVGLTASSSLGEERFSLAKAVPDDVFLCVSARHNVERAFLDKYWDEVWDALKQSGVGADAMAMVGSFLGEQQQAEVDRFKEMALKLVEGVDWEALGGGEFLYAQRMSAPLVVGDNLSMGPPDMVWLMRGASGSASKNYEGLGAILQTLVSEVNTAAGNAVLNVKTTPIHGASVMSVNLLESVPNAPPMTLSLAMQGDVIAVGFGDKMFAQVLARLSSKDARGSIAATERFKAAFAKLPPAEDEQTFFDMNAMLSSFRSLADTAEGVIPATAGDEMQNVNLSKKADALANEAYQAYQAKDYDKALKLTKEAHDIAPTDSRIMYNLACFHSLLGHKDDALTWLEKAVAGGFHAPKQIMADDDLKPLRGDKRFEQILAKAKGQAAGEADAMPAAILQLVRRLLDVPGMVDYIASVSYTEGHSVRSDSVTVLMAGASAKPFYSVFGNRKATERFDRYVPKEATSFSVGSGIDFGQLYKFIIDSISGLGAPGEGVLAQWNAVQQGAGIDVEKEVVGLFDGAYISVSLGPPAGGGVVMLKITDEAAAKEKLATALSKLTTVLQNLAQQNPMMGMLALRTSDTMNEALPGFHNVQIGMMPQAAVCGVTQGYLVLASSAEAAALCLATADGTHPSVRKNAQVMSEMAMPTTSFRSLSFNDQRNLGTEIATAIAGLSMAGGMAAMAVPDPDAQQIIAKVLGIVGKLAPVAQKIDFFKSSSEYTTFDGKEWYTRAVTNYQSPTERVAQSGV